MHAVNKVLTKKTLYTNEKYIPFYSLKFPVRLERPYTQAILLHRNLIKNLLCVEQFMKSTRVYGPLCLAGKLFALNSNEHSWVLLKRSLEIVYLYLRK